MVLADKIFEPLDTLVMAYESRLESGDTLGIQWKNYLDLELEKRRFAIYKCLVEVTQKLMEQNYKFPRLEKKIQCGQHSSSVLKDQGLPASEEIIKTIYQAWNDAYITASDLNMNISFPLPSTCFCSQFLCRRRLIFRRRVI